MTISSVVPASVAAEPARADRPASMMTPSLARTALAHAAGLGIAADALFRLGPGPVAWTAWVTVAALVALSLVHDAGRRMSREALAWLAVAVLAAAGMTWRDAGLLQFADFVVTVGALVLAAIAINHPAAALLARRLRDTLVAALLAVRALMFGAVPVILEARTGHAASASLGARARHALRPVLIAIAILIVFGTLLRNADPIFASFVQLPDIRFGELVSHVVLFAFFACAAVGWARAALGVDLAATRAPERLPFSVGTVDVTTALGTLTALFAIYVVSQLGWFFGGDAFLRARTGLTVAEYARQGFFQMTWVALLVVPLLLLTRATLRDEPGLARRHTLLSVPLLLLLGAMIVSAVLRMRLYVQHFGFTIERFYALVLMGWLTLVLAWLAVTVLRGRGRYFVAGAVVSGLAIVAALHVATPDVVVARANVRRASAGGQSLDLAHLAALGGDAVPITVQAVLQSPNAPADERCAATGLLLRRWGPASYVARRTDHSAAWRTWNAGDEAGLRAVTANSAALRRMRHEACPAGRK